MGVTQTWPREHRETNAPLDSFLPSDTNLSASWLVISYIIPFKIQPNSQEIQPVYLLVILQGIPQRKMTVLGCSKGKPSFRRQGQSTLRMT